MILVCVAWRAVLEGAVAVGGDAAALAAASGASCQLPLQRRGVGVAGGGDDF